MKKHERQQKTRWFVTSIYSRYPSHMPRRPKKPPWNAGKGLFPELTGGPKHVAKPLPPPSGPAATLTTGRMVPQEQWECGRCENIREGLPPPTIAPDHSPRCPYRGTGRDPAVG